MTESWMEGKFIWKCLWEDKYSPSPTHLAFDTFEFHQWWESYHSSICFKNFDFLVHYLIWFVGNKRLLLFSLTVIKQWSGNQTERKCFALKRLAISKERSEWCLLSEMEGGFHFPTGWQTFRLLVSGFQLHSIAESACCSGRKHKLSTFGYFCCKQSSNLDF